MWFHKIKKENLLSNNSSVVVLAVVLSLITGAAAGLITSALTTGLINNWMPARLYQTINHSTYQANPGSEEARIISAVKKIQPSVVSIVVSKSVAVQDQSPFFLDIPGFNFPDSTQPAPSSGSQKVEVGGGTGFIITSDGLILTNKHVVADSSADYTVVLADNKTKYSAKVVATDPFNDIAVIKIEAKDLPAVALGDSDKIQIGQTVLAIGNSLAQFPNSVTRGIISGIGRQITAGGGAGGAETLTNVLQTDAAINPGNSGGPLINLNGEVVGINTAVSQSGQSIGFALPINGAKKDVDSVKQKGKIVRAYLGVRYIAIDQDLKEKNNLPVDYGALVVRGQSNTELAVIPGGPADKAGIAENEILLEVNGVKIDQDNTLSKLVGQYNPGDKIQIKLLDKGKEKTVTVTLEEYNQK